MSHQFDTQRLRGSAIRVMIADDHAVLRAGLRMLLQAEPDMEVVAEASDGREAIDRARVAQPDVLLLDISMPAMGGLEVIQALRRDVPRMKILILTMYDDEEYLRQALAAGASGYVLKRAADTELLSAIRAVHQGGTYLHPAHARLLLNGMLQRERAADSQQPHDQLSEREREVIRLVALGYTNQQIADRLFLSIKTVETYRSRAMEKLGLRNRAELVRYALEHHLLDLE